MPRVRWGDTRGPWWIEVEEAVRGGVRKSAFLENLSGYVQLQTSKELRRLRKKDDSETSGSDDDTSIIEKVE